MLQLRPGRAKINKNLGLAKCKLWADKALVGPGDGLRVQKGSRFGSINIGCTEMTSSRGTSPRGTEMTDMALKCAPCSWVS